MQVQLSEPARLLDLAVFLSRLGLVSQASGDATIEVRVAHALNAPQDAGADRLAIVRALREWCAVNPGTRTDLLH